MPPRSAPGVSVTRRALGLLDHFTAERPLLSLSELSRAAAMPLSTTHRLLDDLEAWGAVERGADGRYRVGMRLWQVASLAPMGVPLREAALPFLEDLYEATHENVQLSVLDGENVLYVERLAGRDAVRTLVRVGGRFSLHATAGGLVLLAHGPTALQESVLGGTLERYTSHTFTQPAQVRRILAGVRRDGYSCCERQVTDDAMSVAAPIRGAKDEVIAALSLVATQDRRRRGELVSLVRAGARGISRVLGSPRAQHAPDAVRLPDSGDASPDR